MAATTTTTATATTTTTARFYAIDSDSANLSATGATGKSGVYNRAKLFSGRADFFPHRADIV
jgi:hypothetical protein